MKVKGLVDLLELFECVEDFINGNVEIAIVVVVPPKITENYNPQKFYFAFNKHIFRAFHFG